MRKAHTDGTLCIRCARAGACTIPDDSGEPVLACARFDSLESFPSATGTATTTAPVTRIVYEIAPSRIEGLCGDCGNRETCVFRGREGGIWHCEEYC